MGNLTVDSGRRGIPAKILKRVPLVAAVAGLPILLFCIAYTPWVLHWGATEEEILRDMPGDEIVAEPTFNATRSVTIEARPAEIWPWIVQIGYLKAGFYSYDRLDNKGVPSADQIVPEYQSLEVGDLVPLTSSGFTRVVSIRPDTYLCLVCPHHSEPIFTWVWGLYPVDEHRTRLVVRLRWYQHDWKDRIMTRVFEIVMMKKHILGIKKRAESIHR